jgi:hypothetical protein
VAKLNKHRHRFQVLNFIHKFVLNRDKLLSIFSSYFTENRFVHSHDTRNRNNFHIPSVQTAIGKRSAMYKGCSLWNSLPEDDKIIEYVKSFKIKLRSYHLNQL